jgi:hypothetical protein
MLPFMLILIFLTICFIYYFNQKQKIRRDERREQMRMKQEELLRRIQNQENFTQHE